MDSALIAAIVQGAAGLAQSFLASKQNKAALDQSSAQADDQYAIQQQALEESKREFEINAAIKKKQMMMDAYQNYANAYGGAAYNNLRGYDNLATSMEAPLMARAKL